MYGTGIKRPIGVLRTKGIKKLICIWHKPDLFFINVYNPETIVIIIKITLKYLIY